MPFRDSEAVIWGKSSSAQITVPATVVAGDVLFFAAIQAGGSSSRDFTIASSNGGTFTPLIATTMVGTNGQCRVWKRVAVAGDAGSTVTVAGGTSSNRWNVSVAAVSAVDEASAVASAFVADGDSTTVYAPALSPQAGSSGGTVVREFFAVVSNQGMDFSAQSSGVLREEVSNPNTDAPNSGHALVTDSYTGDAQVPEGTIQVAPSTTNRTGVTVLVSEGATPKITATAPEDVSAQAGDPAFNLQASDTAAGGASITSRQWTQTGTAVTLANASTQTVQVTPPAAAGSTTLTYTVTDSGNGLTASDSVVITWTAAPTGTLTVTQARVEKVDARAYGSPVTLTQTSGPAVAVTEPVEGLFLVPPPAGSNAVFTLSADDGLADPVTVTVTPAGVSGAAAVLVELVMDADGTWSDPFELAPSGAPAFLASYSVVGGVEAAGWSSSVSGTGPPAESITVQADHVVCTAGGYSAGTHYARKVREFLVQDGGPVDGTKRFILRADFELPTDFYTRAESFMRWFNVDNYSNGGATVGAAGADEWRVGFGPVSVATKFPCLMSYHENNQDMNLWQGASQLAVGRHTVEIDFTANTPGATDGAWTLTIDGVVAASATAVQTVPESVALAERQLTAMYGGVDGAYAQTTQQVAVLLYGLEVEQP